MMWTRVVISIQNFKEKYFNVHVNQNTDKRKKYGHIWNVRLVNIYPKTANLTLVGFSMKQSMYNSMGM